MASSSSSTYQMDSEEEQEESKPMSFHFSNSQTILVACWTVNSDFGIAISCIFCAMICFIYEGIKWLRMYLRKKEKERIENSSSSNGESQPMITQELCFDYILNIFQLTLLYSLMLIVMTFNVWLLMTVVLGEATSHLFFRIMFKKFDYERFKENDNCAS